LSGKWWIQIQLARSLSFSAKTISNPTDFPAFGLVILARRFLASAMKMRSTRRSPLCSRNLLSMDRYFSRDIWFHGVSLTLSETNLSEAVGSALFTAVRSCSANLPTFVCGSGTGSAKAGNDTRRRVDVMIERIIFFTRSQHATSRRGCRKFDFSNGPKGPVFVRRQRRAIFLSVQPFLLWLRQSSR